jgi:hypothetical protein
MIELLSVIPLGLILFAYLFWGFRTLPQERWQFIATLPLVKDADGHWRGVNLTYYGFFSAAAYVVAVVALLTLLGAIGVSSGQILALVVGVLIVCVPASRIVAGIVEKKRHTFSVAAAFFVALFAVPAAVFILNALADDPRHALPYSPVLAAAAIAYAFGEGLGRLGCISFGCCYGKRLEETSPWVQKLFARWHFVFHGRTKKIAYAGGLDGARVLPVQGLTALLYVAAGLLGFWLFLRGRESIAFVITIAVTQMWRLYSEALRADYRGGGQVSAYQWMAVAGVVYAALAGWLLPAVAHPRPDLFAGVATLWHPGMLLFLQVLWIVIFIYTGRSSVTEARVAVHVCHDRV